MTGPATAETQDAVRGVARDVLDAGRSVPPGTVWRSPRRGCSRNPVPEQYGGDGLGLLEVGVLLHEQGVRGAGSGLGDARRARTDGRPLRQRRAAARLLKASPRVTRCSPPALGEPGSAAGLATRRPRSAGRLPPLRPQDRRDVRRRRGHVVLVLATLDGEQSSRCSTRRRRRHEAAPSRSSRGAAGAHVDLRRRGRRAAAVTTRRRRTRCCASTRSPDCACWRTASSRVPAT